MPRKKNKHKNSGLGGALKNKFGGKPDIENKAKGRTKRDTVVKEHFNIPETEDNAAKLKSITEVSTLQEFVDTMAAVQKLEEERKANDIGRVIVSDPLESTAAREQRQHQQLAAAELFNYENLPIPRKPKWDQNTTAKELQFAEGDVSAIFVI